MVERGRISHRELCKQTGYARSTISEHLSGLIKIGVVRVHAVDENGLEYELTDPDRVKSLIRVRNPTLLTKATDRFIDLWDF
jgi:predicted transcriptional regulator